MLVLWVHVLSINFKSLPKTVDYELYNLGINSDLDDLEINFLKNIKTKETPT